MAQRRHHHAVQLAVLLGATPWGLAKGYAAPARKVDSSQLPCEECAQGSMCERQLHRQAQYMDGFQMTIESLQTPWEQATHDLKTSLTPSL